MEFYSFSPGHGAFPCALPQMAVTAWGSVTATLGNTHTHTHTRVPPRAVRAAWGITSKTILGGHNKTL